MKTPGQIAEEAIAHDGRIERSDRIELARAYLKLQKQNAVMRTALSNYANRDNWVRLNHCNESHWDYSIPSRVNPNAENPRELAARTLEEL